MGKDIYSELREAKAEFDRQWNWGGGRDLEQAQKNLEAVERRVREHEKTHPLPRLTWPSK